MPAPSLLSQAPSGSFEGLEEHRESLIRFLRKRLTDESDVLDITQEALIRGARYRRGPMEPARLRAWLLRIASNLHTDLLRNKCKDPSTGHDPVLLETLHVQHEEDRRFAWRGTSFPWSDILDHLRGAVSEMPQKDRWVLEGFYERRASTQELANDLGVSSRMVKVRLFRARRRLKGLIEQGLRGSQRTQFGLA